MIQGLAGVDMRKTGGGGGARQREGISAVEADVFGMKDHDGWRGGKDGGGGRPRPTAKLRLRPLNPPSAAAGP